MESSNRVTRPENPFRLTKAVDLSDDEIAELWVNLGDGETFESRTRPRSMMPMLILGGKGSGKTHLMRYYSYQVQKIRHGPRVNEGVQEDGYLGIYIRCSGLNASRFQGKNYSGDHWLSLFAYYIELWTSRVLLSVVGDYLRSEPEGADMSVTVASASLALFDRPTPALKDIAELSAYLGELQKDLDYAVNNAAFSGKLDVDVKVSRGKLLFGLPKILAELGKPFSELVFLYLIDEYENLSESAQRYMNTLVREKEMPVTFKIGAKLYGMRTYKTLSGDEELKEGSEYEKLVLDADLRKRSKIYKNFAINVCAKRLTHDVPDIEATTPKGKIGDHFAQNVDSSGKRVELVLLQEKYANRGRPWVDKLRTNFDRFGKRLENEHLLRECDVDTVLGLLEFAEDVLLEKTNIFLIYRAWDDKKPLLDWAKRIQSDCHRYRTDEKEDTLHATVLDKFKEDLIAQMVREADMKQTYVGFESYVDMSQGITRNLLTILRQIFDWALFNGETPFRGGQISLKSQRTGVMEASEWFYQDAQILGGQAKQVRAGIDRLATLFREIRFSDKPSECSLCTFSFDARAAPPCAMQIIEMAEQWSLLLKVGEDRKDRNSQRLFPKYQINSMLAPRYSLPIASRGNIHLSAEEIEAIFCTEMDDRFDALRRCRVNPMNAPFGLVEESAKENELPL